MFTTTVSKFSLEVFVSKCRSIYLTTYLLQTSTLKNLTIDKRVFSLKTFIFASQSLKQGSIYSLPLMCKGCDTYNWVHYPIIFLPRS